MRVPDAVQREAVHRRSGTHIPRRNSLGPGSAAHHVVLRCARDTSAPFPTRVIHCNTA
jgi:hypothetical protein